MITLHLPPATAEKTTGTWTFHSRDTRAETGDIQLTGSMSVLNLNTGKAPDLSVR